MKDYIFKNGLFLGALSIFISLISYILGVDFKLSIGWNFIELIAPLIFLIFLIKEYKKINSGYLNYNQSFIVCFGLLATSSFIHTFFKILLFNYIDPLYAITLQEATIQKLIEFMIEFFSSDVIDELVAELESQNSFSISSLTKGFTSSLFFFVLLSLIIAFFIRKNPPIENE
jgi:ABC-type multidrug transport system fused ATPase/permease subunit